MDFSFYSRYNHIHIYQHTPQKTNGNTQELYQIKFRTHHADNKLDISSFYPHQ